VTLKQKNIMSWGVKLNTEIHVPRVYKSQVNDKIEENDHLISMYEKEMMMLVSSNPREIVSEDARNEGCVVEDLRIKMDQIFEAYKECIIQNGLLTIILEELNEAEDC
jgi:hypothetical protein